MKGMTGIVKKVAQLMAGPIFMFGIYILVHGHLTPGGGFAGGAIIAGSFVLLILANGTDYLKLKSEKTGSSVMESAAILSFLILSVIGLVVATRVFFYNFLPVGTAGDLISAGFIPISNILIGVEVAAALLSIFLAFVIYKEELMK